MKTVRPLIGRGKELSELPRLLHGGGVLTLLGPPGIGKSRLAAELATRAATAHQPAWLTVAGGDDELVLAGRLGALIGLEPGPEVLAALTRQLALAPRLVVIDGCEWSPIAARRLAETLLAAAPATPVLATSREPLGANAEVLYAVRPLDEAEAVELFSDRATRARAGEALPPRDEIAEVCALLDRLPLSIELVATRLTDTPWPVVMAECRRGVPTTPLWAALEASHDRLSEPRRQVFRSLAVFAGGFDVEATSAVVPDMDSTDLRSALTGLASSSLIGIQRGGGGGRGAWEMLDTIKAYALERLRASSGEEETRRRHAEYCLSIARRAKPNLISDRQAAVARDLEPRRADIQAALQWSRTAAPDLFVEIVTELRTWWLLSGDLAAGRRLLHEAAAIARPGSAPAASALLGALRISLECGLLEAALEEGERAAAIYASNGNRVRRRRSAVGLAWATALLGELETAGGSLRVALADAAKDDDQRGIYDAGWCLGQVEWRLGDHDRAIVALEKARSAAAHVGAHQLIAHAEDASGHLAVEQGHVEAARRYFRRALAAARQCAGPGLQVHALDNLARLELADGDPERARAMLLEGLVLATDHGVAHHRLGSLIDASAWLAHVDGRQRRAIRLAHAAAAFRRSSASVTFELWTGSPTSTVWLDRAAKAVGAPAAVACAADGEAMSWAEAVSLARQTGRGDALADQLSAREAEVAVLVSRGLTNRAIAERLGVSPRTVDTHLEHVRAKLNLGSRSEVAAWAAVRRAPE